MSGEELQVFASELERRLIASEPLGRWKVFPGENCIQVRCYLPGSEVEHGKAIDPELGLDDATEILSGMWRYTNEPPPRMPTYDELKAKVERERVAA